MPALTLPKHLFSRIRNIQQSTTGSALPHGYTHEDYTYCMYWIHIQDKADWIEQNIFYYFDLCKPTTKTGTPTAFVPIEEAEIMQRRIERLMVADTDCLHERHAAEWADLVDEFDTYAQDLGDWYRNQYARGGHEHYVDQHNCEPIVWRTVDYSAGGDLPATPLVSPGTIPASTWSSWSVMALRSPRLQRPSSDHTVRGRRLMKPIGIVTAATAYKTAPLRPKRSRHWTESSRRKQQASRFIEHTDAKPTDAELEAHYGHHDAFPRRRWEVPSPAHEFVPDC